MIEIVHLAHASFGLLFPPGLQKPCKSNGLCRSLVLTQYFFTSYPFNLTATAHSAECPAQYARQIRDVGAHFYVDIAR